MRVLHITWSADKAGMLIDLLSVQRSDASLKLDVCFGTRGQGIFVERLDRLGIKPCFLCMKSRYGFWESLKGGLRLREVIHSGSYDIIHMQEAMIPFPFMAAAEALRAKVILHNRGEFNYTETLRQRLAQQMKKALYRRLVPPHVDRLICNSRFTVEKTPWDVRYRNKIEVLHNAVDLNWIGQISARREALRHGLCCELGLNDDVWIIAVVARLVEFKRIDRFIRAFAKAAAENSRLVALIAGEGPLRGALVEEAAQRGLGERICFLGHRSDAKEITASANLFVLPSAGEAFGIAALEAVALQVPVMLFDDAGGPLEFVQDGVNGCIVAGEAEMAQQLGAICRREKMFQPEVGVACDIQGYARRIQEIYDELLSPTA